MAHAAAKLTNPVDHAKDVLATEIRALQELSASLDERFAKAVEIVSGIKGRVAVTGIGKSGHVARKIAATMASTGTPAFFVHPAEASHGDMGMITRDDCVLALSNSGEASELSDIIAYTRRFSIPLIAMTSGKDSNLGGQSDLVLEVPKAAEACPMGLAPTSSTTMMMALGDALAVALLHRNGFTSSDYKVFHPGGKLGRKLLLVRDIMHTGEAVPVAAPTTKVSDIILIMTNKTFGCCGIIDTNNILQGIITDGDLRRHMKDNLLQLTAQDIMTRAPKTIGPHALAVEALGKMNEKKVTSFFVLDEKNAVQGIIRMHDLLKAGIG
ncbi:MAG: KpsF/GutQ family sugar-phosphate isomerase [Alphaproteobacteria bacterium]|nr:KpsF/GutQ family sugar-phosphate isomerase [Alphaproteobacteria bacterium]